VNTLEQLKTAYNKGFAIAGFPYTADTFVVNQSLVFQIKFYGKIPALRVAAKPLVASQYKIQQ
jgi:hypothetical protein